MTERGMAHRILVVGATGNVGRPLMGELVSRGVLARAATRSPERTELTGGSEPVRFDLQDPETFGPALEGVDRVFLLAPGATAEPDRFCIPFVDRAVGAGVKRIVCMTAMGVEYNEDAPHRKVERAIERSGIAHAFLRPNWFMQNFSRGFLAESLRRQGVMYLPAADAKVSFVDVRDIAAVAAEALLRDDLESRSLTLTGPEAIDHDEVAGFISEATGREVRYVGITDEQFRQALDGMGWDAAIVNELSGLFRRMREGVTSPVTQDVFDVLGRSPVTFRDFARDSADAWM